MEEWHIEQILITVRTYPDPSEKYIETSCVAGVSLTGQPMRLYPVRARDLYDEQRFSKFTIIEANVMRNPDGPDSRPESHHIDHFSIKRIRKIDAAKGGWARREQLLLPFRVEPSVEALESRFKRDGKSVAPSLALIRPRAIERLMIQAKDRTDWTSEERAKLQQQDLFVAPNKPPLQFIPFKFQYRFVCDDPGCTGHSFQVWDWEMLESYRRWRRDYGDAVWQAKFRGKYEDELVNKRDLQFFLGTINQRPWQWTIIGLYYPPKQSEVMNLQLPL